VKEEFLRGHIDVTAAEPMKEVGDVGGCLGNSSEEDDSVDTGETADEPVADFDDYSEPCEDEEHVVHSEEVSIFYRSSSYYFIQHKPKQ
jgi:hypothetical protein